MINNFNNCITYNDIRELCNTKKIKEWFINYYNYPDGILNIVRNLDEKDY